MVVATPRLCRCGREYSVGCVRELGDDRCPACRGQVKPPMPPNLVEGDDAPHPRNRPGGVRPPRERPGGGKRYRMTDRGYMARISALRALRDELEELQAQIEQLHGQIAEDLLGGSLSWLLDLSDLRRREVAVEGEIEGLEAELEAAGESYE